MSRMTLAPAVILCLWFGTPAFCICILMVTKRLKHIWKTELQKPQQDANFSLKYMCTVTTTIVTQHKLGTLLQNTVMMTESGSCITYVSCSTSCDTLSAVRDTETRIIGPFIRNTNLEFPAWMDRIVSWVACTKDTNACITPNMVTSLSSFPYLQKKKG
jgi:hypothetical protein